MRRLVSGIGIQTLSLAFSTIAVVAGCSGSSEEAQTTPPENTGTSQDALIGAVPQMAWVEIAITGLVDPSAAASAASSTNAQQATTTTTTTTSAPMPATCTLGEPAGLAAVTRNVSTQANGLLGNLLTVVSHIVSTQPAARDDHHAAWGPITSPTSPGIYRLDLERAPDGAVAFVMSGRPKDLDAWRPIFRGATRVIDADHRVGEAQVDFSAMHSIDPTNDPTQGGVAVKFGNADGNTAVEMTFNNVAGPKSPPPTDAHYAFIRRADGAGTFDFVAHSTDPAAPAEQLIQVKTLWGPQGAGKASATVISSAMPKPAATVECWAPNARLVFKADSAGAAGGDPACCPASP